MANELIDAFSGMGDMLMNNTPGEQSMIDPEEIKRQMESLDPSEEDEVDDKSSTEDTTKDSKPKSKKEETNTEDVTEKVTEDDKEAPTSIDDDFDEIELTDEHIPVVVEFFSDKFVEKLGWEFEEGEKPKSIEDLVKYMQGVIDTNSQPRYSSNEIKELDEFVANGGDVKDYFNRVYSLDIDPDKVDLSKEINQKAVIKENLRSKGYSEQRIAKLINRFEESSTLEEEAEDSLEEVKEARSKAKQELLEKTRIQQEDFRKQQQAFTTNVEKIIKDSTDIRGVTISNKEKDILMEYIFKPTSEGMTQYQKDYNSNLKNLVESAYFTMKGDKFVQQLEKKAATNAARNLTLKLKTKGKSTKNTDSDIDHGGKASNLWDMAGSQLRSF